MRDAGVYGGGGVGSGDGTGDAEFPKAVGDVFEVTLGAGGEGKGFRGGVRCDAVYIGLVEV